jgi:hypothetical protein
MPQFTIETTYPLPVYRHRTYEADTIEQACRLALEDDDWSGEKQDYESAGATIVTGIWEGADAAYRAPPLAIPAQYAGSETNSVASRTHVLVRLEEARVREQIAAIIDTDPTVTRLAADAVSDADIHAACLAVAEQADFSEERGGAEFRAALAAIREVERRQATSG